MEIGERIKIIRKNEKLTQQKFAERIRLKRNTIGNYEISLIEPSDRAISDICREFNVNENWLRRGEGQMYKETQPIGLDALARKFNLQPKDYALIERLIRMSPEERDGILRFMQDVVAGIQSASTESDSTLACTRPASTKYPQEMTEEDLHAELDRQLAKEKKVEEESLDYGFGCSDAATG